jgi:hypothetical protein
MCPVDSQAFRPHDPYAPLAQAKCQQLTDAALEARNENAVLKAKLVQVCENNKALTLEIDRLFGLPESRRMSHFVPEVCVIMLWVVHRCTCINCSLCPHFSSSVHLALTFRLIRTMSGCCGCCAKRSVLCSVSRYGC